MPKMNGLEVLKTIRDKENLIPILMLLLSKRAIEPVVESYEKQMKTTMIEFLFSEVISEEAQSFQGLAKVKGKKYYFICIQYFTAIDQRKYRSKI